MEETYEHGSSSSAPAKKSNSAAYEMIPLEESFEPTSLDVICARGKEAYNHPGNVRFRALVASQLDNYKSSSSKMAKSQIVKDIIEGVRQASPKGGFVKKVNGKWFDVGERARREKTGQQIRDLLHESYKSSTKSKALTRKRIRKSHSTNTHVARDVIRGATKGTFYTPGAGDAPYQRSGSNGLPPKLVSLDSQTADAAEMSASALQEHYQHHRRSSDASMPMPQLRRASAPGFSNNGGGASEQDVNHQGMGGMMSMSMGNVAMGAGNMGGMNMGMDAPGMVGRDMNSAISSSMMGTHPNMMTAMGINSGVAAVNSSGMNMHPNMGMNPNMNNVNVIGDMNQPSNMNMIGNMSHPSMQSSGDWGMGQQQPDSLIQQQQQLLLLQQQQERLQEQQRQLTQIIQQRRSGVPSQPDPPAQQNPAFSNSTQPAFMPYGTNMSAQYDMNISVSDRHSNNSMTVNVNNRVNSRPQGLEMFQRADRVERRGEGHGNHPMLMPVNSDDIFADHIPADPEDDSEVSFEEAIDSICQVDEPRKKNHSRRRR